MKKVSIITLGCKVNQVESETIAENLTINGYDVNLGFNIADIYIINTCAVTNEAERKSRNIITKVLKLNPQADIYICGCSSEKSPESFKKCDNVKAIIGTKDKLTLVKLITNYDNKSNNENLMTNNDTFNIKINDRTRSVLWVQNGCNNFCTYCIIPYLRGRETSFSITYIQKELKKLETFSNEIIIAGINLSSYGSDLENNDGLIEIARLFKNSPSRFRFSSLEVNVITDEFLNELSGFNNFCEQFHLSLQSGSNNTLKKMNRHYTKEQYLEKVNLIRKYFPNAGITTDIIIGFPTETEADYNESLEFVREVNFFEMHIFPYSKRTGTVAASFKNIATNIDERIKKMTQLATDNKHKFIIKNYNTVHEVIIENQKNGYYLAHTKNYILCYIKSDKVLKSNSRVNVKIKKIYEDGAIADIIS